MKTWGSRLKWVSAAIALSAIMLCCAIFSFMFLEKGKSVSADVASEQQSVTDSDGSTGATGGDTSEEEESEIFQSATYSQNATLVTYYELNGTNNATAWSQAVSTSINNNGLLVTVRLTANWSASNFGSGTGFYTCLVSDSVGRSILQLPTKSNILLDLNGFNITHTGFSDYCGDGCVFYMNGGTLQVTGNGQISGGARTDGGGAFLVNNNGTLVLSGGTITGNKGGSGGAIFLSGANASLTVDGAIISGNTAKDKGGAIYAINGAKVRIQSGTISENTADVGGGIYINNTATLNVSGGYIMGNFSLGDNQAVITESGGGGVAVNKGTFTMDGGTISNNIVTKGKGGGVFFFNTSTFTLNGGTISNNSASGNISSVGGGVRGDGSTFYMYGGTITQNTVAGSSADAGGIGIWDTTFEMYGGTVSENRAMTDSGGWSGALETWRCTVTMYGGKFLNNQTNGNGGAMTIYDNSTFTMYGGEISANRSAQSGGGIIADNGGKVTLYGGTIANNIADGVGGGVYSTSDVTIGSKTVTKNGTTYGGGFKCYDNIAANIRSNIYLPSSRNIIVDGTLVSGGNATSVGVSKGGTPTATAPITFITSYDSTTAGGLVSTFFFADNTAYKIEGTTSGQIALGAPATAICWTYSSSINNGASWQSSTMNVKEFSQTYTGNWFRITASAGTVTTQTTGTLLTGGSGSNTYKYFRDVGIYTFIVNDAGYTNNTITIKIAPRAVTISWSTQDLYYTAGKTQYPDVVLGGIVSGDDCKLTVDSSAAGINAGTYTVTASLTGAQVKNYELPTDGSYIKTYNILPRKLSKPYINGGLTYDGTPKQLLAGFDPTGMKVSYTDSPAVTNYVNGTNAGTYNAVVQLIDPTNFRWEDNTTSVVYLTAIVNKVVLSVSGITLAAKEYDGNNRTSLDVNALTVLGVVGPDYAANGEIDHNKIWIIPVDYDTGVPSATGDVELDSATAGQYSKKFTLQMTGTNKDNYMLLSDVYECITYITRATIKITGGIDVATVDGLKGKVYDANTTVTFDTSGAVIVYSSNGAVCTDDVTVEAYGNYTSMNAAASVQAVIWSLRMGGTDSINYELDVSTSLANLNGTGAITGTIKPKDVDVTVTTTNAVYGNVPGVTYAVTGAVAGENVKVAFTYLNGTDSTTALKTVGTYTITTYLAAEFGNNYHLNSVTPAGDSVAISGGAAGNPVKVKITPADLTITVHDSEAAFDIVPTPNGAFVSGLVWGDTRADLGIEDADLKFTFDGYTAADFMTNSGAVGTYALSIDTSALSIANYNVHVVDGEFTVSLRRVTVTLTVTHGVYGGTGANEAKVTYTVATSNGAAVNPPVTLTYSGKSYDNTNFTDHTTVPNKAGEYTVSADVDTASGYTGRATALIRVSRAALTVASTDMVVNPKTYDGTTLVTISVNSFSGRVGSDVISITATGLFDDAQAGNSKPITVKTYTLSGTAMNNYYIDTEHCATQTTGRINPKDVSAIITATDCVYGNVPNVTYTVSGAVAGEDIRLNLSYELGGVTTALKNAGTYTVKASLGTGFDANYNLTTVSAVGGALGVAPQVTISKAPLTINVYNAEAEFGEGKKNNGAYVTGLVWDDTRASVGIEDSDLTFTYGNFDADSGAVGTYVLSISPIALLNYTVSVNNGTFAVGLTRLTVTLTVTNGVYGGTGSDKADVVAVASNGGTTVSVTINLKCNGKAYDGTVYTDSATVPAKPGEYTVLAEVDTASGYTGTATALVKVSRAVLTVAASDLSVTTKTYDGTTAATVNVNSFSGAVGSDVVTVTATGVYANANAGTGKQVDITDYILGSAWAAFYYIDVDNSAKQITGDIDKKDIDVTVTAETGCVYGSVPNVTYAVSGAAAGEDVKLQLTYKLSGTAADLKDAGTYSIEAVLASDFAGNYNIASYAPDGGNDGDPVEVSIAQAPLTITVYNADAAYGADKKNNGAAVVGLVWGDTRASLGIENADLTFTYGDFDTDSGAVGTYVLSIDTSSLNLANYAITVNDGTFAVGLKQLTVTITVTNGVYGGTGSDKADVVAVASNGGTAVSVQINYIYNGTSFDGTVYTNSSTIPVKPGEYEVIAEVNPASGYTGRATSLLKINRAALTVTVVAKTAGTSDKAEYGTDITNLRTRYDIAFSGWVNNDEMDGFNNPTQTGDIVPTDAKWRTDYFRYAPVGTYDVIVTGLSSDNYEITYVNGSLTIEKANATVTINNQSSVYNGNVPVAGNVTGVNFTVAGLQRSADNLGVSIAIASAAKDAGAYDLEVSASNGNYNVTFVGESLAHTATDNGGVWTIAGAYTVEKAKLTITADNKTVTYGDEAPAYTATYDGFVASEGTVNGPTVGIFSTELTLGCAYVKLDATNGNATTYAITEAVAAEADNYDITFVSGVLTVNAKAVTVAIDRTKTTTEYGVTPLDLSVNTSDYYILDTADLAQATDDLLITLTHSVTATSDAGTYVITAVSGNSNYDVTFTDCVYTVEQYRITVDWVIDNGDGTDTAIAAGDVPQFEYNGAIQGPKAYFNMPTGRIPATVISGLQKNAGTGYTAAVVIPAAYKGNYTFDASTNNMQEFEITPRQLTITWTADKKDADNVFYFEFNNGLELHPDVVFGNVVAGETVEAVYVGATGMVCTHHTVEVQITDKNYSLPTNTSCVYYIVQMSLTSFYWTYDGTTNINATTYVYTYNGQAQMPTAVSGAGVTFSYTITYSDGTNCGNRSVNAGEYTVTAIPSDSSYTVPAGTSSQFTFTIAPKEVKISEVYYDTLMFDYTGSEQAPDFWYLDVDGARILLDVTVNGEHKVADTYTAEIAAPNNKNYEFSNSAANYEIDYTIRPKDIEVEWTLQGGAWQTDFVYDGSTIAYTVNAKMNATYAGEHNAIGFKFEVTRKDSATSAASVWTGDIGDAGIYTLRAYVSDSALAANYNVVDSTKQINIDKLPLQITVNSGNNYSIKYNDMAPAYTATFTGFLSSEAATVQADVEAVENWIFSPYIRGSQPGSYDVTLTTDSDKLKLIRQILRNYDWEQSFTGVKIVVDATTGTVLVLADNGTNEFVYDGTVKLPEAFYTPTTGNGQQRKLDVKLMAINPDGSPNTYLTSGEAINEGTYYISVTRVSGDNDLTSLDTNGLYFKIIKRTVIVKIHDREEDYGVVTQANRKSHIVTEYLSSYGGRNGYLPLTADEGGLAIDVDCKFLRTNGTGNFDSQGYAQVGEYLIEGSWNRVDYGTNYDVIFVGGENGVNGQLSAGLFKINKAQISVISNGDAYFEEYGDFNTGDPRYVIKLAEKTDGVYNNIIYSGNKRAGNTDAIVTIRYSDRQRLADAVKPATDAEYLFTDAPRITAAGDWVIYYSIEVAGGNHDKYYGAWRVQVRPEDDFIIIIFEKEFIVPYGNGVPEDLTEQLYDGGYYKMGNNAVSKEWFKENATAYVAGVTDVSEVGLYNIYFTVNEGAITGSIEYAIKYSDSNYTPETNLSKFRIEQRLLTITWSEDSEFEYDGEEHLPELSIEGWANGGVLTADGIFADSERRYVYKDGVKEVIVTVTADGDFTEIGGHAVKVAVGNANYRIDVLNAVKSISIKSNTVVEYGHLPTWAWYAIGGGGALLALIVVILAVKLKHRKPYDDGEDEGFYDDFVAEDL